jgi:Mg/Co/Ni transporter MgtE
MARDVVALADSATVRDASEMFLKQRLLALPVVDAAGRLHGVIDVAILTGSLSDVAARQRADDIFHVTMTMATAAMLGVALPGALRAVKRDPRIASGPIVLALNDLVTLIFYFNVAGWLLG